MQSFELPQITVTGAETKQESEDLFKSTGYYSFKLENEKTGDSMQTEFRRFSDFEKLYNNLFRGIDDVVAPKKNYLLSSGSQSQINRRIDPNNRVSLWNVLQSMLNHRPDPMKPEFLAFLLPQPKVNDYWESVKVNDNWESFLQGEPVNVVITILLPGSGEDPLSLTVQRSSTARQIRRMIQKEMKLRSLKNVGALTFNGKDLDGTIGKNGIQNGATLFCQLKPNVEQKLINIIGKDSFNRDVLLEGH